jgi:hypothetical protein
MAADFAVITSLSPDPDVRTSSELRDRFACRRAGNEVVVVVEKVSVPDGAASERGHTRSDVPQHVHESKGYPRHMPTCWLYPAVANASAS